MARHVAAVPEIRLDTSSAVPLHRQLYEGLRDTILAGRLSAGTRLPATRILARELQISRNTVLNAFERSKAFSTVLREICSSRARMRVAGRRVPALSRPAKIVSRSPS